MKAINTNTVVFTSEQLKSYTSQNLIDIVNLTNKTDDFIQKGKINPFSKSTEDDRLHIINRGVGDTDLIRKGQVFTKGKQPISFYFKANLDNILQKAYGGKKAPTGEVRVWGGTAYKKMSDGKWKTVGKHGERQEGKEKEKEPKKEKSGASTFTLNNKTYKTMAFSSEEGANKYMKENPGTGLIGQKDKIYHVAKNKDKGTLKNKQ